MPLASPSNKDPAYWLTEKKRGKLSDQSEEGQEKMQKLADAYSTILENVGEDLSRDGILKTPMRAAKAMAFFTQGYELSLKEIVNEAIFQEECNEMVRNCRSCRDMT